MSERPPARPAVPFPLPNVTLMIRLDFERKITARGVIPTKLEEGAARGQKAC
jgi:hypothetical protein